jgi:hypothetical protein
MYKSLFIISIPAVVDISSAVTTHAFDFDNFIHSTQTSALSRTKFLRLSIISIILSLIHGRVEYS